jgi:hypothetical protein
MKTEMAVLLKPTYLLRRPPLASASAGGGSLRRRRRSRGEEGVAPTLGQTGAGGEASAGHTPVPCPAGAVSRWILDGVDAAEGRQGEYGCGGRGREARRVRRRRQKGGDRRVTTHECDCVNERSGVWTPETTH